MFRSIVTAIAGDGRLPTTPCRDEWLGRANQGAQLATNGANEVFPGAC